MMITRTILLGMAALLTACNSPEQGPSTAARPVAVATVETSTIANALRATGDIQAQKDIALSFRVAGRVTERAVTVGDRVQAGQVVAKLDPQAEDNALRAARATLAAANGEVVRARSAYERQAALLAQGFTTRPRYDEARTAYDTAQAQLETAEANVRIAEERRADTELRASAAGVVTARTIEPGEVVAAGQPVIRIARDDERDAVFDVPAQMLEGRTTDVRVRVALVGDDRVTAYGRVREVSPQADPVTRTFRVRVGLENPPPGLALGAVVAGTVEIASTVVVSIPVGALTQANGLPAVWIVDPATQRVSLRPVDILRFEQTQVVISQGLQPGEIIVTAGVQALFPGQLVAPIRNGQRVSRGTGPGQIVEVSSFTGCHPGRDAACNDASQIRDRAPEQKPDPIPCLHCVMTSRNAHGMTPLPVPPERT